MLRASVKGYTDWVSVISERKVRDTASLREWLEECEEVLSFGIFFTSMYHALLRRSGALFVRPVCDQDQVIPIERSRSC